jgi:hypothetical protein
MTERPETIEQAIEDRDITLALTPAQLILLALGLYLLVRFIRSLRD